jgi:hypothetical protein
VCWDARQEGCSVCGVPEVRYLWAQKLVLPLKEDRYSMTRALWCGGHYKAQNSSAGEEVTLPWNAALCRVTGYHYSRKVLTDFEAVWNKSSYRDFVLDVHWQVLLFPIMSAGITQKTKETWLAVVCFIDALLPPVFCGLFVLFRAIGLSVWAVDLWQRCLCTLLSLFWTETRNTCKVRSNSFLKILTGLSTYVISKAV